MSPRILDLERCRHCQAPLGRPTPRVCPACGGSLQKRYLALGCLTSAPPPVLLLAFLASLAWGGKDSAEAHHDGPVHVEPVRVERAAPVDALDPRLERDGRPAPVPRSAASAIRTTRGG